MKLFTLNATPVRGDVSEYDNGQRVDNYPKTVARILARHGFDGFTIYKVDGYWEGTPEVSFKIEVAIDLGTTTSYDKMAKISEELRDMYNQDSVMLTLPDNSVEFI